MTELDLYKFVTERECEYHWTYHIDGIHLVLFISSYDLKDFCEMLGHYAFDDGGLACDQHLCYDGSVGLARFEDVCEEYGIDAKKVFKEEE